MKRRKKKIKRTIKPKQMVRIDSKTVVFADYDKDPDEYREYYLNRRLEIQNKYGHN